MVVQPRLDVPPEILEGLTSGVYKLFGGTVRHAAAGHIVRHLQDAPVPVVEPATAAIEGVSARVASALKNPWVIGVTLLGTVVVSAAAAAIIISHRGKPKEKADSIEVPVYVTQYNEALRAYLEAARSGSLDASVVSGLIDALDDVATDGVIDFANDESDQLLSLLVGYTRILADANSINLDELLAPVAEDDPVGNLRQHLVAQHSIFQRA